MEQVKNGREQVKPLGAWEKDGYKWVIQNGIYVPANKKWQPLDLSPQHTTAHPWPGDFCYVHLHPNCINRKHCPNCKTLLDTSPQLAFVWLVEEDEGFANILLASDKLTLAEADDVKLYHSETRIPFEIMVQPLCGPIFFEQLSAPVGYAGQEIIDKLVASNITGEQRFPAERYGLPAISEQDPRHKYATKRLETLQKLHCYCLSKLLEED